MLEGLNSCIYFIYTCSAKEIGVGFKKQQNNENFTNRKADFFL